MNAKSGVYDLTDEEESDGGYDPIPRGNYVGVIDETTYDESKNGNPMLVVRYEIKDGEYEGRRLWDRVTLSDKALPIFKRKIRIMMEAADMHTAYKKLIKAVDDDKLNDLADDGELLGAEVMLTVGIRNWEGEKRNEIKRIAPSEELETGDKDFMEDDEEEKPKKKKKKK